MTKSVAVIALLQLGLVFSPVVRADDAKPAVAPATAGASANAGVKDKDDDHGDCEECKKKGKKSCKHCKMKHHKQGDAKAADQTGAAHE